MAPCRKETFAAANKRGRRVLKLANGTEFQGKFRNDEFCKE